MPLALILLAIIAIIAIFAFGYHAMSQPKPFSQQVASMKASADSQLFVVGTLAPLGSFEYESSPLLTRLAVLDRHADSALQRGQISHDAAADVLAEGDSAYAVIAQATRVCDPAAHTGKCQGDRKGAKELLGEARRTVQGIPDYTPSR
jgi:hypothetical protein